MSVRWTREELTHALTGLFTAAEIGDWFREPSARSERGGKSLPFITALDVEVLVLMFLREDPDSPVREKVLRDVEERSLEGAFRARRRLIEPHIDEIEPVP